MDKEEDLKAGANCFVSGEFIGFAKDSEGNKLAVLINCTINGKKRPKEFVSLAPALGFIAQTPLGNVMQNFFSIGRREGKTEDEIMTEFLKSQKNSNGNPMVGENFDYANLPTVNDLCKKHGIEIKR